MPGFTAGRRPAATWPSATISQSRAAYQVTDDFFGGEVLLGDLARGTAIADVIALDLVNGGEDILGGAEGKEAFARGEITAKTSVLINHRPARSEVTGAAV